MMSPSGVLLVVQEFFSLCMESLGVAGRHLSGCSVALSAWQKGRLATIAGCSIQSHCLA